MGIDMLFDQPTEAHKDRALYQSLRALKTPAFVSFTDTPSVVTPDQLSYMKDFVPAELRAAANLATDPFDGAVRWIFPGGSHPETPLGFARKAVELAGKPLPSADQIEIAWRPQPDTDTPAFKIYPSHAVAALPKEWLEGKIVLVGAVLSLTDKHRTPLSIAFDDDRGMMPGILVQAHALATYLEQRSTRRLSMAGEIIFVASLAGIGAAIAFLGSGLVLTIGLAIAVLAVVWIVAFAGYSDGIPLIPLIMPTLALAFALWATEMWMGRAEKSQRQFVQRAFSRYVSPDVVQQLIEDPSKLAVSGQRQDATFLFTDIAGFTTLSESLDSHKLSELLNAYLDGMCSVIQKYQGTIDKFIGDAVMAVFNAPLPQADHAERAVRCALELDHFAEQFRAEHNSLGIPLGVTRIGIHSGQAVVGNFGSHSRMDFTALGDAVNVAARVEGVNKYFGTRICCTQAIVDQCEAMRFLPLAEVVLKGKAVSIALYAPRNADDEFCAAYLQAYNAIETDLQRAAELFQELVDRYPEAAMPRFYLKRLREGLGTQRIVMEDK
jgi:class 3 adenylate cyclase